MHQQLLKHRRQVLAHSRRFEVTPPTYDQWCDLQRRSFHWTQNYNLSPEQIAYNGALILPVRAMMITLTQRLATAASPDDLFDDVHETAPLIASTFANFGLTSDTPFPYGPPTRRSLFQTISGGIRTAGHAHHHLYDMQQRSGLWQPAAFRRPLRLAALVHLAHAPSLRAELERHDQPTDIDNMSLYLESLQSDNGSFRIGCPASFSLKVLYEMWHAYAERRHQLTM